VEISSDISLLVVGVIILTSIALSIVAARRERRIKGKTAGED